MQSKLNLDDLFQAVKEEDEPEECIGLVFRCAVDQWIGTGLDVNFRTRFRFVKSKSCPGCDKCDWMWDDLHERMCDPDWFNVIFDNPVHNKLYTLKMSNVSTDWETGYVDDFDLEFTELKDEAVARNKG